MAQKCSCFYWTKNEQILNEDCMMELLFDWNISLFDLFLVYWSFFVIETVVVLVSVPRLYTNTSDDLNNFINN